MKYPEILDAIQKMSQQYGLLKNETIDFFAERCKIVLFNKKTILLQEGERMQNLYFVIQGGAREFYYNENKDVEISSWFSFENEFVTNTKSFFLDEPSLCYLETLEDSIFLEIKKEVLLEASQRFHDFETLRANAITKVMHKLQDRNYFLLRFRTAEERYKNLLEIHEHIGRIPNGQIASFLGIRAETFSRTIKKIAKTKG